MNGHPVVVGVDDVPASTATAAAGARLARRRGAPLRLVRALPSGAGTARSEAVARLEGVRRGVLDLLPAEAVTAAVREGPADLVLLHESRTAEALVVGPTDGTVPGLGEVATTVVRRAQCPVLVARVLPGGAGVVVGVDAGRGTATLLEVAVAEASGRGTSLLVLHAWSQAATRRAAEQAVADAERHLLDGWVRPLREASPTLPIDLRVVHAPAVGALGRAGRTAAVLVVGRRPGSRPDGTAGTVAATAAGPVLIVPVAAEPAVAGPDLPRRWPVAAPRP